jgi:hypothetical protein
VLHVHPPFGTALATLADPTLLPIDQVTAKFYNRVAIDRDFGGIADFAEEGERLARALGSFRHMILGNHGVLCTGATVAETFDELYFLERAARTLVLAYSTGQPLNVLAPEIAERTARGWEDYGQAAFCHFAKLKRRVGYGRPVLRHVMRVGPGPRYVVGRRRQSRESRVKSVRRPSRSDTSPVPTSSVRISIA